MLAAVLLTGTAALAATLGVAGQLLLAMLGLRSHREHQRRLEALREERAGLEADDA